MNDTEPEEPASPSARIAAIGSEEQFPDTSAVDLACEYGVLRYSEGSVLNMAGTIKTCRMGSWV